MTKNKRFTWLKKDVYAPQIVITDSLTEKDLTPTDCYELLNELNDENERLKRELKIYRNVAYCGNCRYHTYDWFDDGDEFEVCEKGNDMSDWICEEWEEFE